VTRYAFWHPTNGVSEPLTARQLNKFFAKAQPGFSVNVYTLPSWSDSKSKPKLSARLAGFLLRH
jgi:hypothetical protein